MTLQAGTPFTVDPADPANSAALADLFVTPDGGFQVVWQTLDFPGGVRTVTEHYRIFDSAGVPITDEIDAGSWPQPQGPIGQTHSTGTLALADGTTLKDFFTGPRQAELQQFDQNGVAVGSPIFNLGTHLEDMVQLPDGDVAFLVQFASLSSISPINAYLLHNTSSAPAGDTTAPTAVDFFPAAGSTTLPPDWNLGITFSEAVKAGAGTITLETAAGQVVQTFNAATDPGIQFSGDSVVINPAAYLQPGTTYKLIVDPAAVQDLAGNAYAGESGYTFTTAGFTPSDKTAPLAVDYFPAQGSTTLPVDWNLGITFNEAVKAGAGTITLQTLSGQVVQTFAAASDPGIQFVGSSVVINPTADLQPGTSYELVVGTDAVEDLAGNVYLGTFLFFTAALVGVPAG